jgi:hypothetical protein
VTPLLRDGLPLYRFPDETSDPARRAPPRADDPNPPSLHGAAFLVPDVGDYINLAAQETRMQEITRDTRPRMRAVAEDTRASIESVLTDEQRSRFQELRIQRDVRVGPGPWGGRGDGERRRPRSTDTIL